METYDIPAEEKAEGKAPADQAKADQEKARKYLSSVKTREGEFKEGWWKRANDSEKLYSQPTGSEGAKFLSVYNILYSNTEVLVPSLYSATAKPDVRPRFEGNDIKPIPEVTERFLAIYTDGTQPGAESFDEAVKESVLSALTAAAGYCRLRLYDDQEFPLQTESVPYNGLIWGKAKKWARVPWIAFKHDLSKEEFASQMGLSEEEMEEKYKRGARESDQDYGCVLYEFWNKSDRSVWFLSEDWDDVLVKKSDDPMGLKGFYPTPGPLCLTSKPGDLEPVPLYWYYKNQAEELDRISTRLNKVLSAIRVRGAYNSLLSTEMSKILADSEMENGLVAAGESIALAQNGGFEKNIWLLPIEKLIQVAQQLYNAREAIKQVIYELTGISDIIRGSNMASETATATTTKDKWGTIRLRKMQTVVSNYVRDLFRMAVDCGAAKIPAETWIQLTQLPIPTKQQQAVARQTLQHQQQMAQMMARLMPPQAAGTLGPGQPQNGPPNQPPAGPQIPPPDPALVAQAQGPSMEEILAKINQDATRVFTINVQTSSTIDLDTAQDKAEVTEFMNAIGQMLAGLQPLMNLGPSGLEAMKILLISVCQRFKFGTQAVAALKGIKPPPPPPPQPPPPGQSPAELQAIKMEAEAKMQEIQGKLAILAKQGELAQQKLAIEQEKFQIERERMRMEMETMQADHEIKMAEARQKMLTLSLPPATVAARKPQNAPVRR